MLHKRFSLFLAALLLGLAVPQPLLGQDWSPRKPGKSPSAGSSKSSNPTSSSMNLDEAIALAAARAEGKGNRPSLDRAMAIARTLLTAGRADSASLLLRDALNPPPAAGKKRSSATRLLSESLSAQGQLSRFADDTRSVFETGAAVEEWRVLAEARLSLGDRDGASEALRRLLTLAPNDQAARETLGVLNPPQGEKVPRSAGRRPPRPARRPGPPGEPAPQATDARLIPPRDLSEALTAARSQATTLGQDPLGFMWPLLTASGDERALRKEIASARSEEARQAAALLLALAAGDEAAARRCVSLGAAAAMATGQPDEFAVSHLLRHAPGRLADSTLAEFALMALDRCRQPETGQALQAAVASPLATTPFLRQVLDGLTRRLIADSQDPRDLPLRIMLLAAQRLSAQDLKESSRHQRMVTALGIGLRTTNPFLRHDVTEFLTRLTGSSGAYAVLRQLTEDGDLPAPSEIAALARTGVRDLLPALQTSFTKLLPEQKRMAIQAAWVLKGPEAVALLSLAARDPRGTSMAGIALIGLGFVGDATAAPLLRDVAAGSNRLLASAAAIGLSLLPPGPAAEGRAPLSDDCAARSPGSMLLAAVSVDQADALRDLMTCAWSPEVSGSDLVMALVAASDPVAWRKEALARLSALASLETPGSVLTNARVQDVLRQIPSRGPLPVNEQQVRDLTRRILQSGDAARILRLRADLAGLARPAGFGIAALLPNALRNEWSQTAPLY